MIGQTILLNKINNYSINNFPQSIILEGEYGCGKHMVVDYISNRFSLPIMDISLKITNELILEL